MNSTLQWWHIGGLLMGIVQAAYLLINQHYKIEPRILMLWRGFGTAALLLPAVVFLGPPTVPAFYTYCLLAGVCVGIFDRLIFQASAHYGAGITSRLLVLTIPLAFIIWLVLHPDHLQELAARRHIWLLPLALAGVLGSAMWLRRDSISRHVLLGLTPAYLLGAGIDVFNKTAMHHAGGLAAFVTYGCVTAALSGIVNLLWPDRTAPRLTVHALFAPRVWRGGVMAIMLVSIYLLLKTSSLEQTPNPALVSALNLTAPVWVLLWNRAQGINDSTNVWAGFGCVISALLLVLSTL